MSDIHILETNLDLKQNLNIYATCKQFDSLNLVLNIYSDSLQADLSNYNVRLRAMKADKVPLIQEHVGITISTNPSNMVTIEADEQLTTTSGKTPIELQFIDKTTGKKKATFNLVLIVVPSTLEVNASISKATYTLLEELENKLDQASDFFENIDDAIEINSELKGTTIPAANTSNSNLESSIDDANTAKLALDQSKTNATNIKNELDELNTTAINTKNNLDATNTTGQSLLNSLETFEQEHADVTDISNQLASINADLSEIVNLINFPKYEVETDDTLRIDRATDFLVAKGGGKLILPIGTFVASYIKIKKNVIIEGQGFATTLKYADNTNTEAFIILSDGQVTRACLRNVHIDGNKANNTTSLMGTGIKIDGSTYVRNVNDSDYDYTPDNNLLFENLWITECNNHGLWVYGARESRFNNIMIGRCNNKGMLLGGSDNMYHNITSYWNYGIGIHVTSPNNKMSNIKAFGNQGTCGIYFDSTAIENIGANIEVQENYGHGIMIGDCYGITLSSVLADANSYTNANTSYGVHIYNSDKISITGQATDFHKRRNDGQWYQKTGINLYNVSNYNINLNIDNQITSDYIVDSESLSNTGIFIVNGKNIKNSLTKISDDFLSTTNKWNGTNVLNGTADMTSGSNKHPGTIRYRSTTTANSGYSYLTGSGIHLGGGEKATFILKTTGTLTGITRRLGFLDSSDVTAPINGAYMNIADGVLSGKAVTGGATSTTATTYTLASWSWYRLKIEVNYNATLITYTLYADDSDTVLWSNTVSTNIPLTTIALKHGDICTYSGTTITDIGYLDYMDIYLPLARRVE